MFRKIFIIYFILLSSYVSAEEDSKVVRVAVTEYPPFEFQEDNKIVGVDADTVRESFANVGYQVKFVLAPWIRALTMVRTGRVDAIVSIKETKERKEEFLFSDPISYTKTVFFKLKSLDISPTNLNQLKKYTIGIIGDYPYGEKFDNVKFPKLAPMMSDNAQLNNLKKLEDSRVDLVACGLNLCNYFINKYPDEFSKIDYIKTVYIEDVYSYHIAFPRSNTARSQELLQKFNEGLKKYIAEGKMDANLKKYDFQDLRGYKE